MVAVHVHCTPVHVYTSAGQPQREQLPELDEGLSKTAVCVRVVRSENGRHEVCIQLPQAAPVPMRQTLPEPPPQTLPTVPTTRGQDISVNSAFSYIFVC